MELQAIGFLSYFSDATFDFSLIATCQSPFNLDGGAARSYAAVIRREKGSTMLKRNATNAAIVQLGYEPRSQTRKQYQSVEEYPRIPRRPAAQESSGIKWVVVTVLIIANFCMFRYACKPEPRHPLQNVERANETLQRHN